MNLSNKHALFGATALVAGCCIGAGMLALPLATLPSGFFLSILPLLIGWSYAYLSGLMVLEVCLNTNKQAHLMGLLGEALGTGGKIIGSGLFFFLFYSLLTVYLNASSLLIQEALNEIFKLNIPQLYYLFFNSVILFSIVILGAKKIDLINRGLVFLMILFYVCLIYLGISRFKLNHLNVFAHVSTVFWAIPIFILSFGFQNLVPTLFHYLKKNVKKTRSALFRGTFCALMVYLIWNLIVLGVSPIRNREIGGGTTQDLIKLFNVSGPSFAFFIKNFSFFAILTSILTVALSVVNFIADSSAQRKNQLLYATCALLPPTIFSSIDPNVFLKILGVAGGIGAVLLFGVLPPLMIWKKRRILKSEYREILPFGKKGIAAYLCVSLAIITLEVFDLIGKR